MLICFRGRAPKTGRPGQENPGHIEYVIEERDGVFYLRMTENTHTGTFPLCDHPLCELIQLDEQGNLGRVSGNTNFQGFLRAVIRDICSIVNRLDETARCT